MFAISQGHKENVPADIAAQHFHDLRTGNIMRAGNFDVVARVEREPPRVGAVLVRQSTRDSDQKQNRSRNGSNLQTVGGFFGERSSTNGNALLRAQEWRLFFGFQVNQSRIV